MWSIDFCEDNLRRVAGAAAAAEELQQAIQAIFDGADAMPVRFYHQRCVTACKQCHQQSLILRMNDELMVGESHAEVIAAVMARISTK